MLKPIIWNVLSPAEKNTVLNRPLQNEVSDLRTNVNKIIDEVKYNGDNALRKFTQQYDCIDLVDFNVEKSEVEKAYNNTSSKTIKAMERAISQLRAFHELQKPIDLRIETSPGIFCELQSRPIQRIGLYIPGGSAPLVSTVLMLGVPSQLAGCPQRILCSPPSNQGSINPSILTAAKLCGIENIYKVGGAQAIAAMAYGTESIPKVDKIFGPGNSWVMQAKILVAQDNIGATYDLPAGPSEVMVIADEYANAEFVAADLLSQAEHGFDSQVILICNSSELISKVNRAIQRQIQLLPRKNIAEQVITNSYTILVDNLSAAIDISNDYAPEHLILQVLEPRSYLSAIHSAGSIFLGPWSPEAAGDYASGTNHVLPTSGFAKSISGLSIKDFMKMISVQELTKDGLADIAETVRELATIEGLIAHRNAVDIRNKKILDESEKITTCTSSSYEGRQ